MTRADQENLYRYNLFIYLKVKELCERLSKKQKASRHEILRRIHKKQQPLRQFEDRQEEEGSMHSLRCSSNSAAHE